MNKSRLPNQRELDELTYQVAESMGGFESNDNLEQAKDLVSQAYIAVFDNYITDCPGYAGKIMSVIWSSSPDFYEVFTFDKAGNLKKVNQDPGFIDKEESQPF